jgi:hypothetical protein
MNSSQVYGILRIVLPGAAAFAIGKGWITQDMYGQVGATLAAILAAGGFSANANTTLNLSRAVSAVPGLEVHVDKTAPPEMQVAAANRIDETVADIVPAVSAPPLVTSTTTQKRGF